MCLSLVVEVEVVRLVREVVEVEVMLVSQPVGEAQLVREVEGCRGLCLSRPGELCRLVVVHPWLWRQEQGEQVVLVLWLEGPLASSWQEVLGPLEPPGQVEPLEQAQEALQVLT